MKDLLEEDEELPEEYVTLNEEGQEEFSEVFERKQLPVRSIVQASGTGETPEGEEGKVEIEGFLLDYYKFTDQEKENIKEYLMDKFACSKEQIEEDIESMNGEILIRNKWVSGATSMNPFKYT